jgi:lipopolysaccharide export LptBFGC system permease protein LptF
MNRKLCLLAFVAMLAVAAWGDNKQTVTVNGTKQSQAVKRITFNGDEIVLVFADNTQKTVEMTAVKIDFVYDNLANSVSYQMETPKVKEQTGIYNLNGQSVSDTREKLPKGIYIVDGRKEVVK